MQILGFAPPSHDGFAFSKDAIVISKKDNVIVMALLHISMIIDFKFMELFCLLYVAILP